MKHLKKWFRLHQLTKVFSIASYLIILLIIGYIFLAIIYKAGDTLSFEFLFNKPQGFPLGTSGGIYPAIIGSLLFTGVAALVSTVLGLSIAIYIEFYCRSNKVRELLRIVIGIIAGIPSIILGLFGYSFLVVYLKLGISILAGGIVLGLMIFPYIEIKFERIFHDIKSSYMLNAAALGVNNIYFILHLAIPLAWRDLLSTVSLGSSLAMGATAPILLTGAVFYARVPKSVLSPAMALPLHLYYLVNESISIKYAFATASVLVLLLVILNVITYALSYWGRRA